MQSLIVECASEYAGRMLLNVDVDNDDDDDGVYRRLEASSWNVLQCWAAHLELLGEASRRGKNRGASVHGGALAGEGVLKLAQERSHARGVGGVGQDLRPAPAAPRQCDLIGPAHIVP